MTRKGLLVTCVAKQRDWSLRRQAEGLEIPRRAVAAGDEERQGAAHGREGGGTTSSPPTHPVERPAVADRGVRVRVDRVEKVHSFERGSKEQRSRMRWRHTHAGVLAGASTSDTSGRQRGGWRQREDERSAGPHRISHTGSWRPHAPRSLDKKAMHGAAVTRTAAGRGGAGGSTTRLSRCLSSLGREESCRTEADEDNGLQHSVPPEVALD